MREASIYSLRDVDQSELSRAGSNRRAAHPAPKRVGFAGRTPFGLLALRRGAREDEYERSPEGRKTNRNMMEETPEKPARKKRLSRYKADRNAFPEFVLNSRDKEILELVFFHRFIDTELLWHLIQPNQAEAVEKKIGKDGKLRPARQGFGMQALYRRLQLLYHARYLERHHLADQPIGRGHGSPRAIYGIGPKACVPLAQMLATTPENIRQVVEANKVKSPFLRHALDTAKLRVLLELACRKTTGSVRLLFWEQGLHLRDSVTGKNEYGDDERFTVCPDAFFALEVEGKGRVNYMLEVDRGTESIVSTKGHSDIRKKLLGYRWYRRYKRYQTRYSYRRLPDGEVTGVRVHENGVSIEELPPENLITGFTVLFLTTGNAVPEHPTRGRIANILSALSEFGPDFKATTLFWFCPISEFSLKSPETVFAQVWRTAHPEKGLQSLIE